MKNNLNYIFTPKKCNLKEQDIDIHCISKKDYLSDVESLKIFYTFTINKIKIDNNNIYSSIISAGVVPISGSLLKLIKVSHYKKSIIIPTLEDEDNTNNFLSKIKKYERIHFNNYNMNFYDMTASAPIISLFNTMTINNELSQDLINFYSNINENESIDYHDYNLSLYLFVRNNSIIYHHTLMGYIKYSDLTEDPICDYKDSWVRRYSGYYANFFQIIKAFLDCNAFSIDKKIFLFFYIIGLLVEFFFPSLSTMVIYTIFYEAFDIYDIRPAAFCTLLYLFILICSGACSLITNNSQRMRLTNLFFFMFMEIYYFFILICSVIAMDNVKKNKNSDPYKFNTAAITCIIIFTFIPAISPMILKSNKIIENILPMMLYLIFGAPSSSSNFYIAKILNICEAPGGIYIKEKKGIIIIGYCFVNLFFGSLTFYNYNRKKRVESVMGLGIFYLIYNFFKILAIVISIINNEKKVNVPYNRDVKINNNFQSQSQNNNLKNSINYSKNQNINDFENVNQSNNQEYPSKSEIDANNNNNNSLENNNNNFDNDNYQ